jgi:type I restriction enzyme S subunit
MIMAEEYGVTRQALTKGQILDFEIPLPPLAEQRRIVAKVEEVLARVNAARERLAKVPAILKRFRQSVLAAACSGRLTAEWREHRCLEDASSLVARIRDQLAAGLIDPVLKQQIGEHANKLGALDRRDVVSSSLPEIPPTWTWQYLPQLGYLNRGKSRHRPRNAPHLFGGDHPFIQTGDIAQSGGRITKHTQTYSEAGLAQSRLWPSGTICITIAANIANSAILSYPACFPDSVVGLLVEPTLANNAYVEFFIRTARANLTDFAPATAQKNINIEILSQAAVPLPPRVEQDEIVQRVETLFTLADKIEARAADAAARADRLTQAVLSKAFRGELVATEAELAEREGRDFETAGQLLERIRAARPAGPARKPRAVKSTRA